MRQSLLSFPDELIDASRIDGASEIGLFFRIVLPNMLPVMAVLAVAALASIPMLVIFLSLSRFFLKGADVFSAGKE